MSLFFLVARLVFASRFGPETGLWFLNVLGTTRRGGSYLPEFTKSARDCGECDLKACGRSGG